MEMFPIERYKMSDIHIESPNPIQNGPFYLIWVKQIIWNTTPLMINPENLLILDLNLSNIQ